jgi:hypothetical protein
MPYKDSNYIERVSGSKTLWRYMSFAKFMNLLMTDDLHFHNAAGFTDDFEGTVPEVVKEAMDEEYEQAHLEGDFPEDGLERHKELVGVLRDCTYISCWHQKGTESAAMWSKYGGDHGAIAIETSVRRLRQALEDTDHVVHIGEVDYHIFKEEYRDENEENLDVNAEKLNPEFLLTRNESHSFAPFLYKRKSFDYEEEVRAIIQEPPLTDEPEDDSSTIRINTEDETKHLQLNGDLERSGYDVDIFIEDLINHIHVAPETGGWVIETIREAVNAKEELPDDEEEIESLVVKSQLDANPVFGPDSDT